MASEILGSSGIVGMKKFANENRSSNIIIKTMTSIKDNSLYTSKSTNSHVEAFVSETLSLWNIAGRHKPTSEATAEINIGVSALNESKTREINFHKG